MADLKQPGSEWCFADLKLLHEETEEGCCTFVRSLLVFLAFKEYILISYTFFGPDTVERHWFAQPVLFDEGLYTVRPQYPPKLLGFGHVSSTVPGLSPID